MKRILIVDDEPALLTLLDYHLTKGGYQVDQATNGNQALELALTQEYDYILLDWMMPGMDGLEVIKHLRSEKIQTPIMMLTAKEEEIDKLISLELGADDYLTKPFSHREVLARLKAFFRRSDSNKIQSQVSLQQEGPAQLLTIGEISLDLTNYTVFVKGKSVEVTPKEFDLLSYLMQRPGRTLSRERLLNAVWDFEFASESRIVDVHIGHLREKIEEDTKNPRYIKTVRGFGYKFGD